MTDKRLKGIKDSIDLQLEIAKQLNVDNELLLEEKELYEYAEELKKQLEEANKKLYLCTPEIPQNVHGKYVSYVDLVNEMYELKKELEVGEEQYNDLVEEKEKLEEQLSSITLELEDYKTQQQEFIKYLEKERERCLTFYCRTECAYAYDVFTDVLAKYKSIIGSDINVGSKGENKDE